MPEGVKGFQPGRPKTGGRVKKEVAVEKAVEKIARKPTKFVDQLSVSGFDYVKELASVLKQIRDLRNSTPDPVRAAELKFYYAELKSLLPFMAPKLREKEVDITEPAEPPTSEEAISSEDLLNALNGKQTEINKGTGDSNLVATRDSSLPDAAGSEADLPDMVREQEED